MESLEYIWVLILLFRGTFSTPRQERYLWMDSARLPAQFSSHVINITSEESLVSCSWACTKKYCESYHYEDGVCTLYDTCVMYRDGFMSGKMFAQPNLTATAICQSLQVTGNMQNIARNKPGALSSQHGHDSGPSLATDGDLVPGWPCAGTAAHLGNVDSWYEVDIGGVYELYALYYVNREGYLSRRNDVSYRVAEIYGNYRTVVFHPGQMPLYCLMYLPTGTRGRWVRMQMVGTVTVCELEVYILI